MDTKHTGLLAGQSKLSRSLTLLHTLSDETCIPLIEFLLAHQHADFAELLIHSDLDAPALEHRLELLCDLQLLTRRTTLCETRYHLNRPRLAQVRLFAQRLVQGR